MSDALEPIQLFVPTYRIDETLAEIRACLECGWTGLGFKTVTFEEAWCRYTALPHAHMLNSNTAGLHLALRLFKEADGWRDSDEVITTPLTFVSTNHAILYENLRPVFADVDETLCLDPTSIRERITDRTRAVIFVGMGGNAGGLRDVQQICEEHNLRFVLDAAHMSGTRWRGGAHVGAEADAAVFSFQAVKNLPTADAGMLCLADAALDAEARKYSWLGINKDTYSRTATSGAYRWRYDVEHVGFKYHGNSIMAAIGLVALQYLDVDNAYRRQIAAWYDELLAGTPGLEIVPMSPECEPARHLYQVQVDRRDEVLLALNEAGIHPGVHYHDNTTYRMYAHAAGTCRRAARASARLMSLPMHLRLRHTDVQRVATSLRSILSRQTESRPAAAPTPVREPALTGIQET
ncbi:MAG: DegT/DnrJ/EryC1/StrS family aminotransferase [Phycisphaerae bacterium]